MLLPAYMLLSALIVPVEPIPPLTISAPVVGLVDSVVSVILVCPELTVRFPTNSCFF
jgi:hypothetical protein